MVVETDYTMRPAVSSSPSDTEIEAGRRVTLSCLLHTHDKCSESVKYESVHLTWVDEEGAELENTRNRKIRTTSLCSITLVEELREPRMWTWRCQLTTGVLVQVSATYTIKVKGLLAMIALCSISSAYELI